ncbi:MAG: serine dehydrogenasease [Clostridiaceae bacterium]|nr:serine dehydrogenasease [Clostridiaceae bacterium]
MIPPVDELIKFDLNGKLQLLEKHFNADFLTFYGPIVAGLEQTILTVIEDLAKDLGKRDTLFIILTTPGGSAETVERFVNIIRHHYNEVNFIIPDYAYSAGTIFCMSGDNIYMDYFSVLGPIDPQVQNKDGRLVAALGYLDKVKEMIEKAKNEELTSAEFIILKELDLAELREYEQAKELTIDQLKKWLVKYKFKNWTTHKSSGKAVTDEDKRQRAEEIAGKLSSSNMWKSHGRPINIECLRELRLIIEDYGQDPEKSNLIRSYYSLLRDYIMKNDHKIFFHTRRFI